MSVQQSTRQPANANASLPAAGFSADEVTAMEAALAAAVEGPRGANPLVGAVVIAADGTRLVTDPMVFGRGRKAKQEELMEPGESQEAAPDVSADGSAETAGTSLRGSAGPFDVSEIEDQDGYVDLGALLIAPAEGLQLRLEVEEATQRVVAVTLDLEGSSLQLQAFAAPRSEGLWDEIREQIGQSVGSQGGQIEEIQGSFGTELLAKLPAGGADASNGYRVARFIGFDGPRWFLRGVLGGEAAVDRDAAAGLEGLFRRIVVVRGENPMPPRDLLQLRLPKDNATPAPQSAPDLEQPERGPETTQIG